MKTTLTFLVFLILALPGYSQFNNQKINEQETDAMSQQLFNGLNTNDVFGTSSSGAGDVNGDGYDDIIVGASGYNLSQGRAYIYFGGISMNNVPDVILNGEGTNHTFGNSVSGAGDVNGDGYSDVIVGANSYSTATGRAYIYFGGAVMNNTADVVLTGGAFGDNLGFSVSKAGDVNGDGYGDVIVGATGVISNTGKTYVYYGGASMNNIADVTLNGEAVNNNFGSSVSDAGDVNGDGYSDVVVGAKNFSSGFGKSYIYYGGASMNNTADVTMTGLISFGNLGNSVSGTGDINGDNFDDVIISSFPMMGNAKGYIYFGGSVMNNVADLTVSSNASSDGFGAAVSGIGDINADGYKDFAVGATFNSSIGKVTVYYGGSIPDTIADQSVIGEGGNFGASVSDAGDVNDDGYSDFIAGAPYYSSAKGRVYLFKNNLTGSDVADMRLLGETADSQFGFSVSDAGDVNSDGYPDFITGAYRYSSFKGRAYIYFGGPAFDNIADVILDGEAASTNFGHDVSGAGDVNGDGYDDVIIGAHQYSSSRGRAYLFYGGAAMDNTADVIFTGESSVDHLGFSVSKAGDVNGDGFSDVITGAHYGGSNAGKVYIYFGGSPMNNVADVSISGENSGDNFGSSVSNAGDMNGDSYDDFIISAPYNSAGNGKVYVYFGGSSINIFADLIISGQPGDYLGESVSDAGDINSDGYSDIIMSTGSAVNGKVYLYLGGQTLTTQPNVTFNSESSSLYFGNSISGIDDINNDGYDDIIIGSAAYSTNTGKTYIFFGGNSMDNNSDIVMFANLTGEYFGYSVAGIHDVNNDGFSDVICGAPVNNVNGSGSGAAYVYLSSPPSVKPTLSNLRDVPFDQGGKLNLKWTRSAYDVAGSNKITDYYIEMSEPPSGGNFYWNPAGTVTAIKNQFYSFNVSTPYDSSANTFGTFYYRITARTSNPSEFWRSNVMYGRSIDNISPPVVSPFSAYTESISVRLTWKRSTAPDLYNYILFRSVSPSIDPYTETPLASLTDSTYLDITPLNGLYYYFIVAQDNHNNYSPVAVTQSPGTTKNLIMYGAIQGLYDAVANTMIYDTVTVYLRNSVSPFAKIDSSKKELYGPGTGQEFSFNNAQNGTPYYVVVKHRNAIETWSADPVTFLSDAASIAFSVDKSYAYGSNEIQIDNDPYNVFAFYSGDVNQNGTIDLTDVLQIYNGSNSFLKGYVVSDLTGNNLVDLTDVLLAYNNSVGFVSIIRP
ncbi:MAG: FG-GAP repeat protein [Ignavibacteria bacterium]|nr:FG-GAP repeat protein [Ignavibacteria bacterium]